MAALEDHYDKIRDLNTDVWAISVDTPDELDTLAEQENISFELLSDENKSLISEWDIVNDKERGGIAFPNVYLINQDGEVVLHSRDKTASRAKPEPLLNFLEKYDRDPSNRREIDNHEQKFMCPSLSSLIWCLPRKLGWMSS